MTARTGVLTSGITPAGYGPGDLRNAYDLTAAAAANGAGETVAVVDPYDDPNAESDLATYRSQYGLPACTTANGCFRKVNENGAASPLPVADSTGGGEEEESLDLDAVSAICPNCHIVLAEAKNAIADLSTAENTAVSTFGAKFVTNGWGEYDYNFISDAHYGQYFNHPGVAITAPAGNYGYLSGEIWYPASSQFVTAVGGTDLIPSSGTARRWAETVWNSTGSGCSYNGKPSWQADTGCTLRTANDVAAVADPAPGVAYYDTYHSGGWGAGGGTGVSAAIIASVYALAGAPEANTYPSSYPYRNTAALNNISSGFNGSCGPPAYLCNAGPGYAAPTGLGTPNGTAAFTPGDATGDVITVVGPVPQGSAVGDPASLQMQTLDSASGQTLTYSAGGLPPGLSIDSATGLISGTPTAAGTFHVTVTATDSTGAKGSVTFPWSTNDVVKLTGPGPENLQVGVQASVQIEASDSAPGQPLTYGATGLPPGLSVSPSTGTISGIPTQTGNYDSNLIVTDPTGARATAGLSWQVHGVITLANPGNQASTAGDRVNLALHATDSAPETLSYWFTPQPPGMYMYPNGVISGWPAAPGTYDIATASDDFGETVSASFTWTVDPAPGQGPSGPVRLALGGKCLDDTGDSAADGNKIQVWSCNGGKSQDWTFAKDGTVRVQQKCLDVTGSGTADGTHAELNTCGGSGAQLWLTEANGELYNPASGTCLDDTKGSTANGTQVQIWSCTGGVNQRWTAPAGPVTSGVPGKCLDDQNNSAANGSKIQIWDCTGGSAQKWTVEPDGTVRVNGKCLDVTGSGTAHGTPLQLWSCTGQANQQWRPQYMISLGGVLKNPASGLCLADPGGSTANGSRPEIEACPAEPDPGLVWHIQ